MEKQAVIAVLQRNADALRARGIRHVALFGSVARGTARPGSDLDILIEIDPALKLDVFGYVSLRDFVSDLFNGPVDVVDSQALKPHLRAPIAADAIYAF